VDIWTAVAVAAGSYLLGSISIARLVTRAVAPEVDLEDVRVRDAEGGEGPPLHAVGATTASLRLGPRVGCTIGLLDILKGAVPVVLAEQRLPGYYFLVAALFVVIGHDWPVFHRFRGGGGISPTYGGFLAITPLGALVSAVAGLFFGLFVVRDMLVAYMSGLWFFLLWLVVFEDGWPYVAYGVAINVIFIIALIPDTREHLRKRRAGQTELGASLDSFPMGRGLLRIMRSFGVRPR
jgi:glycerol-3-phosphate acyltransferase PlsY